MATTYLDEIVTWHRARASADERTWQERLESVQYRGPSMFDALSSRDDAFVKVIAEVKRRSPSQGWIDETLDPAALAIHYCQGGARAISVLTDEPFFAGSRSDLEAVRHGVDVPLLRKDFTVSANDVLDTAQMGASTVLLIVAALDDRELVQFLALAHRCGLEALLEVHDLEETKRAVDLGARIVGVNQRDLRSFEVDPQRAERLIASIPSTVVAVAESGMRTSGDVQRVGDVGFDAVLVGETFVRSHDRVAAVRSFAGVHRANRD